MSQRNFSIVLHDNDEEASPLKQNVTAFIRADERGISVEIRHTDDETAGETFIEIYNGELRAYTWTKEQVGNDPTITVLELLEQEDE